MKYDALQQNIRGACKTRFDAGKTKLNYAGLCKLLTQWRSEADRFWLKDAPTHPLQQALKDLERAYTNFFAKRADFPRYKRKGRQDSFRYPLAWLSFESAPAQLYQHGL
jgi:putative transposase